MDKFKFSSMYGFDGRINRRQYFFSWLTVAIPAVIVFLNVENIPEPFRKVLVVATLAALIISQICLIIKRLHDTNHSAWHFLLLIVPIANLYLTYLLFSPGSIGQNRYGQRPN